MWKWCAALGLSIFMAGCSMVAPPERGRHLPGPTQALPSAYSHSTSDPAQLFAEVVARVEPVAERYCRAQRPDLNCDFQIVIDNSQGDQPNAYHTLDKRTGRPLIGFTPALIADARSADEIAFVLGHEAGHHIAGHLGRTQNSAVAGALILGGLAAISGADVSVIESAQQIGGAVGARSYSKGYELEADEVGTVIAWQAGYDPLRGAAFFSRLPDPGDQFLGSHPPNGQRIVTVRNTLDALRAGRIR